MSRTKAPPKSRLDVALVERGLADSRAKAQALVLAGVVYSGERRLDKPGLSIAGDLPLELRGQDHPWVSRGGLKLAHALDHFAIDPAGGTWLDIGASTGGFTDVLLARGAAKVYAVDVGHGQLAWKLRQDPRVVVLERTNARHLSRADIPDALDGIVCDASFIGLEVILPAPLALTAPAARLVALIKPQFEVGPAAGRQGRHRPRSRSASGSLRAHRRLARPSARLGRARYHRQPDHRRRRQPRVPDRGKARRLVNLYPV